MKKIIVLLFFVFVLVFTSACLPSVDETKATNKMQKMGYIVSIDNASVPALIQTQTGKQPLFMISGSKSSSNDVFYAFAFNNMSDAKESIEYIKTWASKKISDAQVYQTGKWIYFGTSQGVKDFK